MERLSLLVKKLQQQIEQQASASQMAVTVQLIQSELQQVNANGASMLSTSKVAVMMPRNFTTARHDQSKEEVQEAKIEKLPVMEVPAVETPKQQEPVYQHTYRIAQTDDLQYDPLIEIPTLSHQQVVKELNEAIAIKHESWNDLLKQEQTELFEKLKETPIRDLRKAIGVNDRFAFINELFRGDEPMYERSIKTINSFHIFAEAEYWINRELKVKIGWSDSDPTVKHFYQLVKRRFS